MTESIYVTDRQDWRAWLKKNHAKKKEIWLMYYKRHTGKPRIPYDDAVEEALCFGWIDSTVKKLDEEKYAQKFTPRTVKSRWSQRNVKRAEKMIKEGRMTAAGMVLFKEIRRNIERVQVKPLKKRSVIPSYMKNALAANMKAWKNFKNLAPSYKRLYVGWIDSAKKQETRERRLKEAIKLLAQNKKLGLK